MLVTLDVLSGGRTILGAGVGWLAEEFAALDARPFAARRRVTDECLDIVKHICQGGEVTFHGEHYHLDPVVSRPGSVQRPHPPILIGGTRPLHHRMMTDKDLAFFSAPKICQMGVAHP
jgi:alkanesulfonate monooxygenase SsuD/methylene tetrahydromethanopterin reductase-like flavin-dependent oxidoreductase (luciferase family)